ncbi:MAG TPA: hypothetical protein VFA60_14265 [Terriglobales bacterium]|nr:hypothetical protein [Terriglobales bacterium]
MPVIQSGVRVVASRLPKVMPPAAHAIADYAIAASFLGMAAFFWRRDRRAAVACIGVGASQVALSLFTDYPGGLAKRVSFHRHGRIDMLRAGVIAGLPGVMEMEDASRRFFATSAIALTAIAGMTAFEKEYARRWRRRAA